MSLDTFTLKQHNRLKEETELWEVVSQLGRKMFQEFECLCALVLQTLHNSDFVMTATDHNSGEILAFSRKEDFLEPPRMNF